VAEAQVGTLRLATGLSSPTYLTAPPEDFDRLFVTELPGDIEILDATTGAIAALPFLSLANVETLASIAFHPNYATNRFFYVYYRDTSNEVRLVRYQAMSGDPDHADPSSAMPLLNLTNSGHFGGWIGFGPDGYLYVQIGDGGDFMSHDAPGNGQGITSELNANILRIDVDGDDFPGDPDRNYAIPSTNPFVGVTGLDEIWAYGLRNPWRGSFDRLTGDYYFADVGQDTREELDVEEAGSLGGRNYGWRLREGSIATPTGGVGGPQPPDGVDPVYEYATNGTGTNEGNSITGGYVYRGPIPGLRGLYFFGDFGSARIWSLQVDPVAQTVSDFIDWTSDFTPDVGSIESIVSFGEDARGHLYIVDFGGEIFRVTGPEPVPLLPPFGGLLIGLGLVLTGSLALRGQRSA
jgi:glucose/arabinose dehydrogenase